MTAAALPRTTALPKGLRVLVVEDEMLLAMSLEDMLAELGCNVVGPVGGVTKAVQLAKSEPLDLALLDLNIGGQAVYPVARELDCRHVRFVFVSGYGPDRLPQEWRNRPMLEKPFQQRDLERVLSEVIAGDE
jgi:CheY-like chemotaxis protein